MGLIICEYKGVYNFYSTISDGFYFEEGLTLEEVNEYVLKKNGTDGVQNLPERIKRAQEKGCSHHLYDSLKDMILSNRAGDNETCLTYDECLSRFFK